VLRVSEQFGLVCVYLPSSLLHSLVSFPKSSSGFQRLAPEHRSPRQEHGQVFQSRQVLIPFVNNHGTASYLIGRWMSCAWMHTGCIKSSSWFAWSIHRNMYLSSNVTRFVHCTFDAGHSIRLVVMCIPLGTLNYRIDHRENARKKPTPRSYRECGIY
jgi:hypothetical protein